MAGGKETPRQKMIGMMYLVLTALLAMNVSKDILDAFVIINSGIETTNRNFENKNENTYNDFDKAKMNDPIKVTPFWQKAQQAKKLADELDLYMEELKHHLIRETDKVPPEIPNDSLRLEDVNSKDNYDIPTMILIGEPANPKDGERSAKELKGKISQFRDDLLNLIENPVIRQGMNIGLETKDFGEKNGTFETWETGIFYHVPLAAVITALSKLQSDVRNAEADIIKQLYGNISANDFKFDTLAAKVIPNTKYVFLGDTFKAEVLVAAFSTTQDPVLEVGFKFDSSGVPVPPLDTTGVGVSRGVGIYKTVPKTEGLVEWGGVIKIKKPDGTYQPYTFRDSYMVAKPNITVSPTAMNVFYRGLDNPVEVSAPGVALEQLKVTIDNGSLSGSKGKYTVRPGNGREANVIVSAELNGQSKKLGQMSFRVKDVPDPKPYFAGKTGSDNVSIVDLKAAQAVFAKMENFEFDLKFDIVSFTMSMNYKGNLLEKDSNSNRLTGEMVDLVKAAASKGAKVFIEKIKAKGPDGKIRDLPPISLKVL